MRVSDSDNPVVPLSADAGCVAQLFQHTLVDGYLGLRTNDIESSRSGRLTCTGSQPVLPQGAVSITSSMPDHTVLFRQRVVPVARIEADALHQGPQRAVVPSTSHRRTVVSV